jgi:hypothetical protein
MFIRQKKNPSGMVSERQAWISNYADQLDLLPLFKADINNRRKNKNRKQGN